MLAGLLNKNRFDDNFKSTLPKKFFISLLIGAPSSLFLTELPILKWGASIYFLYLIIGWIFPLYIMAITPKSILSFLGGSYSIFERFNYNFKQGEGILMLNTNNDSHYIEQNYVYYLIENDAVIRLLGYDKRQALKERFNYLHHINTGFPIKKPELLELKNSNGDAKIYIKIDVYLMLVENLHSFFLVFNSTKSIKHISVSTFKEKGKLYHPSPNKFGTMAKTPKSFCLETLLTKEILSKDFKKAQVSWLSNRFYTDKHIESKIDSEIQKICFSNKSRKELIVYLKDIKIIIYKKGNLLDSILESIEKDISNKQIVVEVTEMYSFLRKSFSNLIFKIDYFIEYLHISNLQKLTIDTLLKYNNDTSLKIEQTLNKIKLNIKEIDKYISPIFKIKHTIYDSITKTLKDFKKSNIWIVGKPYFGKTHALAKSVELHLSYDKPALMIEAKSMKLHKKFDLNSNSIDDKLPMLLSIACDNLDLQICDLYLKNIIKSKTNFLIAIDGLEESTDYQYWTNFIKTLEVQYKKLSNINFIFSSRFTFHNLDQIKEDTQGFIKFLPITSLEENTLELIRKRYFDDAGIKLTVPEEEFSNSWLSYILDTPLTIRLFSELYDKEEGSIDPNTSYKKTIYDLWKEKISLLEEKLFQLDPDININKNNVLNITKHLANMFIKNTLIPLKDIHDSIFPKIEHTNLGAAISTTQNLNKILSLLVTDGILTVDSEENYTFHEFSIFEFSIANSIFENYDSNADVPQVLKDHKGIRVILASISYNSDTNILSSPQWKDAFSTNELETLKLDQLKVQYPDNIKKEDIEWVKSKLS